MGMNSENCRQEMAGRGMKTMKSKLLRTCIAASALGLMGAAWPMGARAQAPAGPLPAATPQPPSSPDARPDRPVATVKPRTSILGAWKLNRDESDDPRQKLQQARGAGGGRGGGGVRMGIPGMGGGPYGGRRGGGGNENTEDQQRMQQFMTPSRSLTLAEAKRDVEIDMFDDQQRKSAFFTDGRKLQKTKDSPTQEIAAHWDGSRLVTDEKGASGKKMSRTYELSYDGTQLYETLRFTRGHSDSQVSIRYVYDQADTSTSHATQTRQ
jgi:hypothetical protein